MPSKNKEQQKFFQVIRAVQEGHYKNPPKDLREKAKSISKQDAHDFATKVVEKQALCYLQHNTNQLGLTNNHMSNPFAQFEKTASELGFTAEQVETIKKEAEASFDPSAKEKAAEELIINNYVEGFIKSAMESGVSFNEAKELLIVANTVKTAEELSTSLKGHFGKNKQANMQEIGQYLAEQAQAHPTAAGAIAGATGGGVLGGLAGGGKGALMGAAGGAALGGSAGHAHSEGAGIKERDAKAIESAKHSPLGQFGWGTGVSDGIKDQQIADVNDQSNIGAYLRHLMGSKPYGEVK